VPVILAALLVIILVLLASVVLIPITIIQRYRVGTMRRRAQPWLITLNVIGISLSIVIFLASAALTNIWIPQAFVYAAAGVAVGVILGLVGLGLTRWEYTAGALHYTPNRWLVLAITLAVAGRIGYGFWRSWQQWQAFGGEGDWIVATGLAGSLAAGATVLGYYFAYWLGVRRRAARATARGN
jgi:hypothetical protein